MTVIVAVSKLMASGLNRTAVNNCLQALKNYAAEDKGMKHTAFSSEVKDLTKKIHTVLQATAQMKRLSNAYESLAQAYKKVVDVMGTGKRLLGKYFRVAFFGQMFGDDDGKDFIYKEPKITGLAEISHRLEQIYCRKHGRDNIKLIMESAKVHAETLDAKIGDIQITYVQPFFDDEELELRPTLFERNNNIRRFIYETPFTCGGKAHGSLTEQCKRKTILTTTQSWKRKNITIYIQTIALAVEKQVAEKSTALVSHVNAGPLAYAQGFLDKSVLASHPHKHIEKLQQVYREFIACCGKALEINDQLIKEDQRMYQEDMKEKYVQLKTRLAKYIGDEVRP
ncbi:dedicator of cytokinesis protein 9-like [Montipora capricornis]|uniref:dedicator of cytokinesis protein 9-like n=1 Tax=Montipora capricornis TaxID=246305 RepID=UPI0035F2020F